MFCISLTAYIIVDLMLTCNSLSCFVFLSRPTSLWTWCWLVTHSHVLYFSHSLSLWTWCWLVTHSHVLYFSVAYLMLTCNSLSCFVFLSRPTSLWTWCWLVTSNSIFNREWCIQVSDITGTLLSHGHQHSLLILCRCQVVSYRMFLLTKSLWTWCWLVTHSHVLYFSQDCLHHCGLDVDL